MQSMPFYLIASRFLLMLSSFVDLEFQNVSFLEISFPEPHKTVSALDDRVAMIGQLMDIELARIWKEAVTPLRSFFQLEV
jgi:hypothetical protein